MVTQASVMQSTRANQAGRSAASVGCVCPPPFVHLFLKLGRADSAAVAEEECRHTRQTAGMFDFSLFVYLTDDEPRTNRELNIYDIVAIVR